MVACRWCGAENPSGNRYCFSCGAGLKDNPSAPPRGARRSPDWMGLAGFAFFLIIAGIILALNPNIFGSFVDWMRTMIEQGLWIRPPSALVASASLFFVLLGISGFIVAGLRLASRGPAVRALGDAFSGIAVVAFGFLLTMYGEGTLAGPTLLAIEAAICGVLILAYILIGLVWGFRRPAPAAEAPEPTGRP